MRYTIFAAVVAGAAACTPLSASAQYVGTVGSASSTQVGVIDNELQPVFRRYVVEERLPSYAVPDRVVVGTTLPEAGVTYYDVPERFGQTTYRYTVINDRTVLVDPRSRRVMQVID